MAEATGGERALEVATHPVSKFLLGLVPHVGDRFVKMLVELNELRTARAAAFVAQLAEDAGVDVDEIADRAQRDEHLGEILAAGLAAASTTPYEAKRRLLARVVAGAYRDDARIDEEALLVHVIGELEAPHVRVLETVERNRRPGEGDPEVIGRAPAHVWSERLVADAIGSTSETVAMVLLQLQSHGLTITEGWAFNDGSRAWQVTRAGADLLAELRNATSTD